LDIFTEASKVDNKVGAAFVIPYKNIANLIKLSDITAVFQAEAMAIAKVVRYLNINSYILHQLVKNVEFKIVEFDSKVIWWQSRISI